MAGRCLLSLPPDGTAMEFLIWMVPHQCALSEMACNTISRNRHLAYQSCAVHTDNKVPESNASSPLHVRTLDSSGSCGCSFRQGLLLRVASVRIAIQGSLRDRATDARPFS